MKAKKFETIEKYQMQTATNLSATIHFKNKVFDFCSFNFNSDYNFVQWMFLRDIANEIERIKKEMEGA